MKPKFKAWIRFLGNPVFDGSWNSFVSKNKGNIFLCDIERYNTGSVRVYHKEVARVFHKKDPYIQVGMDAFELADPSDVVRERLKNANI
jgi:hypothetical protein